MTIDKIKAVGLAAADLMSSDPFVVFSFSGGLHGPITRRTAIQEKTLSPVFPDKIVFLFELSIGALKESAVLCELWDHNEFRADQFLGSASHSFYTCATAPFHCDWAITDRAGRSAGQVAFNAKIELLHRYSISFSTIRIAMGGSSEQEGVNKQNTGRNQNPKCVLQYRLGTVRHQYERGAEENRIVFCSMCIEPSTPL